MKVLFIGALFLAAIAIHVPPVNANDSEAEIAAGGLVLKKSTHIDMRSEDLFISTDEVRVTYKFYNTSSEPVKTVVAFPITEEDYEVRDAEDANVVSTDPLHSFKTYVDQVPVATEFEQKIWAGGVDLTQAVRNLGIADLVDLGNSLDERPSELVSELMALGLIAKSSNGELKPRWKVESTYYWHQSFPPHREIIIQHRYKPAVGRAIPQPITLTPAEQRRYCTDKSFLRALARRGAMTPEYLTYILTTGANWRKPIGSFTLVVDKGHAENLVSFCASGVKKISPTRFQTVKKNFLPKEDLNVLFLSPNG